MPRDARGRVRVVAGSMIAQRYGIGGKPWTRAKGRNGQKDWALAAYLASVGRKSSPALAKDLNENRAADFYSIGAPYVALASDWLPIATNWTALMPMAVARNFGNLAEMYAMVVAVADLGIRPVMIDSTMVSNPGAGGEAWPWIDALPKDRRCDPRLVQDASLRLPFFLHYCQRYQINNMKGQPGHMFSKYQVPDEILDCPNPGSESGSTKTHQANNKPGPKKNMWLDADGFLPEPPNTTQATSTSDLRHVFSNCVATRATNRAARDYRKWFCNNV